MLGVLELSRRGRPCLSERTVYGLPVLVLTAPVPRTTLAERRLGRALDRLRRAGVETVLPGDFPIPVETLAAHGLHPPDSGPLRRAMLPQLLACMAAQRRIPLHSACVGLSAPCTTQAVCTAAEAIADTARHLVLHTGRGQAALEDHLRRSRGVAPGGPPDLEVALGNPSWSGTPALLAGEGCRTQPIAWRTAAGQAVREELAVVLWEAQKCQITDFHPEWVWMRT